MAETSGGPSGSDRKMSDDGIIDDKALDELLRRGAEDVTDKKYMDCESDLEWCSDAETNTSDVLENALGLEAPTIARCYWTRWSDKQCAHCNTSDTSVSNTRC